MSFAMAHTIFSHRFNFPPVFNRNAVVPSSPMLPRTRLRWDHDSKV